VRTLRRMKVYLVLAASTRFRESRDLTAPDR
jgi:hypothetical protein